MPPRARVCVLRARARVRRGSGGYAYRLCPTPESGDTPTEGCFQGGYLSFATDTTTIKCVVAAHPACPRHGLSPAPMRRVATGRAAGVPALLPPWPTVAVDLRPLSQGGAGGGGLGCEAARAERAACRGAGAHRRGCCRGHNVGRYYDGSRAPFNISAKTTDVGTYPVGSQWRLNPIPMCNCDQGAYCQGGAAHAAVDTVDPAVEEKKAADFLRAIKSGGKTCHAVAKAQCGTKSGYNTCLKCGTGSAYDCEQCCPGCTSTTTGGYTWCKCGTPPPAPPAPPVSKCQVTRDACPQSGPFAPVGAVRPLASTPRIGREEGGLTCALPFFLPVARVSFWLAGADGEGLLDPAAPGRSCL